MVELHLSITIYNITFYITHLSLPYTEIFRLFSACLCVMVGNAEAERVFSCQNRIKTALRSRLSIDTLDQLIRLSFQGIPIDEFPFEVALRKFETGPRRL